MLLGGFGFLSRLHGLSIDSLVEAEVVLADGRITIVSEKEYPGESYLSPHPSVVERSCTDLEVEISGGVYAVAVRHFASRLATKRAPTQSPSSLRAI
jgi:hypothetical protein